MKQIIIPESEVGKYTLMINKRQMIHPILFGGLYTLPLEVLDIDKIDKFFLKLKTIGEVETELKDMPIQDITIIIDKKK